MLACKAGADCHQLPAQHRTGNATPPYISSTMGHGKGTHSSTNPKCGSDFAYLYFCSFVFLSSFLMLNLFVAVIMDNFDYLTRDSSILGAHHLDEFLRAWSEYDPDGTGQLEFTKMFEMLRLMSPPVGFGTKCPSKLAYKRLIRMNMPIDDKRQVHFTTTLFTLIRESLEIKMRAAAEEMDDADNELRDVLCKVWPNHVRKQIKLHEAGTKSLLDLAVPPKHELHGSLGHPKLTVGKIYAMCLYVDNYRSYKQGHSNDGGFNLNRLVSVLKERVHSKEGINDSDPDGRRSPFRHSSSFRRSGSYRSSTFDKMFWGKSNNGGSRRPSNTMENGHINSNNTRLSNVSVTDKSQRPSQPGSDNGQNQHQYGKTLNVPDPNSVHHTITAIASPAPLNPPRPAIMSTPKAASISVKNPPTAISLSPTETRPLLLVTTETDQDQSPQTKIVPQGRRLPLNGRMATIALNKQRQQPTIPNQNHHLVNESTSNQRNGARKYSTGRPRTALFFPSGRADQSPEQHQPLLASSGNDTSSRHDSMDSHTSTEEGFGLNDNWPSVNKTPLNVRPVTSSAPSTTLINTAQPRPQAMSNSRQLPSLPISIRQLPNIEDRTMSKPYFDIDINESDPMILTSQSTRPGELFYYQTSSSSSDSSECSSDENSYQEENQDEQGQDEQPDDDEEEQNNQADDVEDDDNDGDDDDQAMNQPLRSDDDNDDDDDQTSPYEYDA